MSRVLSFAVCMVAVASLLLSEFSEAAPPVLIGTNDFGVFEIWSHPPPVEPANEDDRGDPKPNAGRDAASQDANPS